MYAVATDAGERLARVAFWDADAFAAAHPEATAVALAAGTQAAGWDAESWGCCSLEGRALYFRNQRGRENWPEVDFANQPPWSRKWTDESLEFKPPRELFVTKHDGVKDPDGNRVGKGVSVLLGAEAYRSIPGKDPDGVLDGPGRYNPYEECTSCRQ